MYFSNQGNALYEYSPWNATKDEYERWESEMNEKHNDLIWVSNSYWFLDEVSCVLVLRNKLWFSAAESQLKNIWTSICIDRKNGYNHRAPQRKSKIENQSHVLAPVGCIIDTQTLGVLPQPAPVPVSAIAPIIETPHNKVISVKTICLEDTYSQDA